MAQFYQVLNQEDTKHSEDLTQYYSTNINETIATTTTTAITSPTQTVQYVITPDQQQQQFPTTQQVVVSSEQLMLVDGQTAQSVILDQSGVTYPTSSYITIQDTTNTVDFQNNHQIYYMTNTPTRNQIVVEQTIAQTPQSVILHEHVLDNHQTTQTTTTTGVLNQKNTTGLIQNCQSGNNQIITTPATTTIQQQIRGQMKMQQQSGVGVQTNIVNQQKVLINQETSTDEVDHDNKQQNVANHSDTKHNTGVLQNIPRRTTNINRQDPMELTEYKKLLLQRRNIERLSNQNNPSMNQIARKPRSPPTRLTLPPLPPPPSPQQQQIQTQNRSVSNQNQDQYIIQPPKYQQNRPQRPLPAFLQSSQILSVIENMSSHEKYSDSIRMLVLLDNGEQRLITFTLPKEACTIHEILEQVGVAFQHDTPIKLTEVNVNGLNYVVTVGNVPGFENNDQQQQQQQNDEMLQQNNEVSSSVSPPTTTTTTTTTTSHESNIDLPIKSVSPEPTTKDLPPKIIPGKLAVCSYCGYLSEDFNKCMRCKRKLPDNVKAILSPNNIGKKLLDTRNLDKRLILPKPNGTPKLNLLQKAKRLTRPKLLECETVVVSSDDDEDDDNTSTTNTTTTSNDKFSMQQVKEELLEKLGASVTIRPISKEPSVRDVLKYSSIVAVKGFEKIVPDKMLATILTCRTVRIGSYKFIPPEPIKIDASGFILKVPHPKLDSIIKVIKIENYDIVKVLISFQKLLPVIFYYLLPSVGDIIRNALDMTIDSEYYFDPLSENDESHRRITLLPDLINEDSRTTLIKIYSKNNPNIFDELTYKEANDILVKTCPKDVSKTVSAFCSSNMSDIRQIMMYPQEGRGRISINTEDYMCLGTDQFLNDVIIDFYLKYLQQNLPNEQQEKVHIFSTFFYKRLTTKPVKATRKNQPTELDPNLTPAQKRHARVKTWTKNVNLFEKDYIIIPINENCHWFLAIICFPGMNGTHTMDGQPIKIEQKAKKKTTTTTKINLPKEKPETAIMCEDPDLSDKDEAEGDDSELESDDSEELSTPLTVDNSNRPPIKQPCILIFDSLAGASRSRVVATLRDYLTCEHKAKLNIDKNFTKDIIKGACPKVPQQTNFTDCGLYLLQYVEHFFKDPIKDYFIPIKHLKTWFDEFTVTRKREDISLLIKSLMKEYNKDLSLLPEVMFPTLNGELVDRPTEMEDKFYDPDEFDQDDDDEEEDEDDDGKTLKEQQQQQEEQQQQQQQISESDEKSIDSAKDKSELIEQSSIITNLSELPRQTNKETLSYLKAKRIVRHKNNQGDGPDAKKAKTVETSTGPP